MGTAEFTVGFNGKGEVVKSLDDAVTIIKTVFDEEGFVVRETVAQAA